MMRNHEMLMVLALLGGCAGQDPGPADDLGGDDTGGDEGQPLMVVRNVDGEMAAVRTSVFRGRHAIDDMVFGPVDDDDVLYSLSMEDTDRRWPGGYVPFVLCTAGTTSWAIGCGGEDEWVTGPTVTAVLDAVDYIEARIPGLRFERLLNEPSVGAHYITISNEPDPDAANHAEVGYGGGFPFSTSQGVWLQPMTMPNVETVVHELGHSLGLRHEHQRADRGQYVAAILENVRDGKEHNFDVLEDDTRLTPYDYLSIMHYRRKAFCVPSLLPNVTCQEQQVTYFDGQGFATVTTDETLIPLHDTLPLQPGPDKKLVSGQLTKHDINGLMQMYPPAPREGEPFDEFGAAMVLADFDQDGYDDLAVGVPGEDFQLPLQPPVADAGAVMVFKGTEYGLVPWRELTSISAGLVPATDDEFGASLATGDIDGDGFPDLLVGAPGRPYGTDRPGAVFAFMGGQHVGANWQGDTTPGCGAPCRSFPAYEPFEAAFEILKPEPSPPDGGRFGATLTTGDLDGDGVDEFAVGAPFSGDSGAVYVFEAIVMADLSVHPSMLDKLTAWEDPDGLSGGEFGTALAIGDIDMGIEGYEHGELLVGAPGSDAVYVFTGKNPSPVERISTDGHEGDRFGEALAIGTFQLYQSRQFLVGAPDREIEGKTGAGAVAMHSGISLALMSTVESPFGEPGARFGAALAVDDHAYSPDEPGLPRDDVFVGTPGYGGGAGRIAVLFATGSKLELAHEVPAPGFLPLQFGRTLAVGSVKDAAFEFIPFLNDPARLYAAAPLGSYEGTGGLISLQAGFIRGYVHDESIGLFPRETVTQERQSPFAADD